MLSIYYSDFFFLSKASISLKCDMELFLLVAVGIFVVILLPF